LHTSPVGGHSGFLKTYHRVKKEIFRDGLKTDVQRFVEKCLVFQQNKVETIKAQCILQPLSIPSQCWEEVSMDFITGLPKSEGKSVIMVIVDRLTKYAHFCALSHPFKASTVSTAFMEIVQKLHGSPKIIVSDKDPIFTGHFWTKLFSCLGTQLAHSSSCHPQSNGQTELMNKCLELDEEGKIILEPKAITDTRIRQLRNRSISEYLIKWRKLPAEDSTWEDKCFIQKHPKLLKR
jgi:hypothetical protein